MSFSFSYFLCGKSPAVCLTNFLFGFFFREMQEVTFLGTFKKGRKKGTSPPILLREYGWNFISPFFFGIRNEMVEGERNKMNAAAFSYQHLPPLFYSGDRFWKWIPLEFGREMVVLCSLKRNENAAKQQSPPYFPSIFPFVHWPSFFGSFSFSFLRGKNEGALL